MRIVSVWLPRWPTLRLFAAEARHCNGRLDPARPLALSVEASGGPRIAALNAAAEAEGLRIGDLLADARARVDLLQVEPADPAADDAALRRLALWATRYAPIVSVFGEANGADGFFLDVTGASHLFGGERALLDDLARRLRNFGLPARLAIAGTAGAAWALARFHARPAILSAEEEQAALAPLPIEALRLAPKTRAPLRRLGFKRVGSLIGKPRAPFAARFETELLRRLDQAFGFAPEPLQPIVPPPVYYSQRHLMEPIATQEAIVAVSQRLMHDLLAALARDGAGAKSLRLMLYRLDGEVSTIDIGLVMPTRDAAHVSRLLGLKLERVVESFDADFTYGFGFETLSLAVTEASRIEERQIELNAGEANEEKRLSALLDCLRQRLGPARVRQLKSAASHLPERAEMLGAAGDASPWLAPEPASLRPLFLLALPEKAEVTALVPEGPPRRFRWRGTLHEVAHAQGPERIASEWWREDRPTRDYYVVEDEKGRRFWLYRQGLYGRETASPRWFMHGLFA